MRENDTEQRIYGHSNLVKSSENVLSKWIPFDFEYQLLRFIRLKEDFATGVRPSDDRVIFAHSSQLGPVHLHMELKIK